MENITKEEFTNDLDGMISFAAECGSEFHIGPRTIIDNKIIVIVKRSVNDIGDLFAITVEKVQ